MPSELLAILKDIATGTLPLQEMPRFLLWLIVSFMSFIFNERKGEHSNEMRIL